MKPRIPVTYNCIRNTNLGRMIASWNRTKEEKKLDEIAAAMNGAVNQIIERNKK